LFLSTEYGGTVDCPGYHGRRVEFSPYEPH